jgi:hypothetical protein
LIYKNFITDYIFLISLNMQEGLEQVFNQCCDDWGKNWKLVHVRQLRVDPDDVLLPSSRPESDEELAETKVSIT